MKYKYLILLLLLPILAGATIITETCTIDNNNSGVTTVDNNSDGVYSIANDFVVFDGEIFYLVMEFDDNATTTSSLQLKDCDLDYCVVDWGDGSISHISTSAETESTITPSLIKVYSRNSLCYIKSSNNDFILDAVDIPNDVTSIYFSGNNKLMGDVANLPTELITMTCFGDVMLSGNIENIPTNMTFYRLYGDNTVDGDLGLIPSGITYLISSGKSRISTYTPGHVFSSSISTLQLSPAVGYGLDSAGVDNLLIDLDDSGMSSGSISIAGNNSARTALSDTAVANLTGRGVTVTTN